MSPEEWLKHLTGCLTGKARTDLAGWDAYYEGTQPLSYMHPELLAEIGDRLRAVVINWPRLVVDAVEERLDVEGFRLSNAAKADDELWRIWQANDLDEWSHQAHVEALVMGRAYVIVGGNEDDTETPLVTVESPMEVYAQTNPRTRIVDAAVKTWSQDAEGKKTEHATLYLPGETSWWVKEAGQWIADPEHRPDPHELGMVPVVPLVNRPRLRAQVGKSELTDVIPISDAACKIATDMMVSAEFHAMPRRYALGMGPEDFQDGNGNPLSTWSAVAGRLWATDRSPRDPQGGVEVGQFKEADLSNFHNTLNQLSRLVSALYGLPPHYLGYSTENPASADAIRSSEARLVKRAERKQRAFGGSWEQVARLIDRFRTGQWDDRLHRLETLWRDASTPTFAQKADGVVKLHAERIIPTEQAREDLGYTEVQRNRMREMDAAELDRMLGDKPDPEPDRELEPDPV